MFRFSDPYHHRRYFRDAGYPYPVQVETVTPGGCGCKSGSDFEQKIKENPIVFVFGALLVGYLVAKKR